MAVENYGIQDEELPVRLWRDGIHGNFEPLRHQSPASLGHMLSFIYLAYSMMAFLYEAVPVFEDTWIECLGDFGRYRMAIEDVDIRDREVWIGVARHWYCKASDKALAMGRLYHHLAILARLNPFQQLFHSAKFPSHLGPRVDLDAIQLCPVHRKDSYEQDSFPPLDPSFVKAHGLLFTNRNREALKFFPLDHLYQWKRVTSIPLEFHHRIPIAYCTSILSHSTELIDASSFDFRFEGAGPQICYASAYVAPRIHECTQRYKVFERKLCPAPERLACVRGRLWLGGPLSSLT